MKLFDLTGKTAIVTGCKRGIGMGMAIGLAEAGADIIGVSASLEKEGSAIEVAVKKLGRKFDAYQADFSKREDIYAFVNAVKDRTVDILVNNAGTIKRAPAAEHSDEFWDHVIDVNLTAQFILAREFGRLMGEQGHGKIIFTASLLTFQGGITVPGYASSKGAIAFTCTFFPAHSLDSALTKLPIAPGYIATDNTQALQDNPDRNVAILGRIPADRWGQPEDFKGPIVFLASRASDYVSGEILVVDGGWMGR